MEEFEKKTLNPAVHPLRKWKRYVDDIFVIQDSQPKDNFLQHMNFVRKTIQFTVEDTRSGWAMPFLDIIITPTLEGTLTTHVYRNSMHRPISPMGQLSLRCCIIQS